MAHFFARSKHSPVSCVIAIFLSNNQALEESAELKEKARAAEEHDEKTGVEAARELEDAEERIQAVAVRWMGT